MNENIVKLFDIVKTITDPVTMLGIAIVAAIVFAVLKYSGKSGWAFLIVVGILIGILGIARLVVPEPKYYIRVRFEDKEGRLLQLQSGVSLTGAPHEKAPREGNAEWLFQVFPQDMPTDKKVTVSAELPERSLAGKKEISLSSHSVSATIALAAIKTAEVAGTVRDSVTEKALSGATVYVVGQSKEALTTDYTGGFRLDAHVTADKLVTLHTEHDDYHPDHHPYTAGKSDITINLVPLRKKR